MEMFLAAALIISSVFLMVLQVIRNVRFKSLADRRQKMMPYILGVNAALVICDLSAGAGFVERVCVDVCLTLTALSVMASSLNENYRWKSIVLPIMMLEGLLAAYYVLCTASVLPLPPPSVPAALLSVVAAVQLSVYMYGMWGKVRNIRLLMQSGNVWTYVCLAVDSVYLAFFLMESMLAAVLVCTGGEMSGWIVFFICFLLASQCGAMFFRIAYDCVFVICRERERVIIESMKISSVESSAATSREKMVYKDLYDRLVEYFEEEKPFLRGDLTINDVVEKVFSNKLYISRAISHYTGRNFCQFVNYYRVMYSVDCFRQNTDLRVAELWSMSGFNSIVSYNMAFRLFMGENPSDWCRAEKVRLSRKKTIFAAD